MAGDPAGSRERRIPDEPKVQQTSSISCSVTLFYTGTSPRAHGMAARIMLGMHGTQAEAVRGIAVDAMPSLALAEAAKSHRPRGCNCGP